MSNSRKTKPKNIKPVSERYTLAHFIATLFLTVMFAVFPLFVNLTLDFDFPFLHFDGGYYSIRHQKYYFFLIVTAAALIAEVLLLLTKSTNGQKEKNPDKRSEIAKMTFTDWAVIAFVFACAISTVFSAHIGMAFFGEVDIAGYSHGRNNGLLLMLFYAAVYFFLTRCWRYREKVFVALAVSSAVVYLLAVLNSFYIDPLNMFTFFITDENVFNNFLTTIGNKNMFASHICVTLPVIITMFIHSEKVYFKAVYFVSAILGALASVASDSDSVMLGMGVFAVVYLVVYFRDLKKLRQFLLIMTTMLLAVRLEGVFAALGGNHYKELSAIPYKLMTSDSTFIIVAVLAVLTLAAYLVSIKKPGLMLPRTGQYILGGALCLAALGGIGVVIHFSVTDTTTDLGDLERILRFNDAWGTHRGFMWNKSFEAFSGYNFYNRLFGKGPENFYFTFTPYFNELYDRFGDSSTDAAHNEYINYLMNIGIVGLGTYLAFTGSALIRAFKAAARNPVSIVFASAVIAYMAQAFVNIALPIATPLFIIFVSLCEAAARQAEPGK